MVLFVKIILLLEQCIVSTHLWSFCVVYTKESNRHDRGYICHEYADGIVMLAGSKHVECERDYTPSSVIYYS